MRITIVYQYFQDHGAAGHSSLFEFAKYLVGCGHEVTVVAGEVGYMDNAQPTQSWYRRLLICEIIDGIKILRTISYTKRNRSYFGRLVGFFTFSISCLVALMRGPRPDVIFASSPPLFAVMSACIASYLRGVPLVMEVRDLWPDSAIQMGILRNSVVVSISSAIEKFLYKYSHCVVGLTKGICKHVAEVLGPIETNKVFFVPAGIDTDMLYADPRVGDVVRARHHWSGKCVVLYFGAMGDAHNLGVILRAAARLRQNEDVVFAFVGNGYARARLEQESQELALSNVVFISPVPKREANAYLNAAALCVVSLLDIEVFASAIPTKMLNYMACGKPVLCGVRGEAKRIVEQAGAGLVFEPNDDEELSHQIMTLFSDRSLCETMALKGPAYIRLNFKALDKQVALEQLVGSIVQSKQKMNHVGGAQ